MLVHYVPHPRPTHHPPALLLLMMGVASLTDVTECLERGDVMQRLLLLAVMLGLVLVITVPAMGRDEDPNAEEPNTEERANAEEPQADAQSAGKKHGGGHNKKKNGDGGSVVGGPNFDDQSAESGSIETETNISIEGNN